VSCPDGRSWSTPAERASAVSVLSWDRQGGDFGSSGAAISRRARSPGSRGRSTNVAKPKCVPRQATGMCSRERLETLHIGRQCKRLPCLRVSPDEGRAASA